MFWFPLDEYIQRVAEQLIEDGHPTQSWSDSVQYVSGWELESSTYHTETDQGSGAWRDNVSTYADILSINGEWWSYAKWNETRNSGNRDAGTRLQRVDISNCYLDDPDNRFASLVKSLVNAKNVELEFDDEDEDEDD